MEINAYQDAEELRIEISGRMDAAWSAELGKYLQQSVHSGAHAIALDLSAVTYLSSAGIRVLVILAKQLKAIEGSLRIVKASDSVASVLELVGFNYLLAEQQTLKPQTTPAAIVPELRHWQFAEQDFQVYALNAAQPQSAHLLGKPEAFLGGDSNNLPLHRLSLSAQTTVLGLGAIGDTSALSAEAGELLAVAGLAIVRPAQEAAHPDWLINQAQLRAQLSLLYGCQMAGDFSQLLRFGEQFDAQAIAISDLANAVLALLETEAAVFVCAAETASLVGASLQQSPGLLDQDLFGFPEIRDNLVFTAEPAYHDESSLIVGIVSRQADATWQTFLRPIDQEASLFVHMHAAVMPYRPVPKGLIDLPTTIAHFLESETIRDVLHLLNDDREGIGSGQSYLRRGAVWCAELALLKEGQA